jgi:uncharacterized protein (TIGR01244 family)
MSDFIKIDDRFSVSKTQPTEDDLKELKQEGFQSVVNLRTESEEDQSLSPQQEEEKVRELGMEYLHIPVSGKNLQPELVDRFRQEVSHLPSPVLVHCHTGRRSGAFVMMDTAIKQGMSGEETVQKAKDMGFKCDSPNLEDFVKNYVNQHQ